MIENIAELECIAEGEENVLFLEPRATFDRAIIGMTFRAGGSLNVIAYDRDKCVQALMEDNGWDEDAAEEWFSFNTSGAYMGEGTPVFINSLYQPAVTEAIATDVGRP